MNKFPQFFGQMNDQHIALQFLSSAPHEWQFGEEGVTLLDENKQSVNQWNFEEWFYVDTTQQGDFTPPGEYQLVMSKTLLWAPGDRQARVVRLNELRNGKALEGSMFVYQNQEGLFDHLEFMNKEGTSRVVTKVDFKRMYRFFKNVGLLIIFFVLWVFILLFKKYPIFLMDPPPIVSYGIYN